jgi:DNA-binding NarL/FixJ family response regulator
MRGGRFWRPRVLVVEDDPIAARALERLLAPALSVVHVRSRAMAFRALAASAFAGALVDLGLGADRAGGFDVLQQVPQNLPRALVTGVVERWAIQRAAELGVSYFAKPCTKDALAPFVARVGAASTALPLLREILTAHATRWRLSPMQARVLASIAADEAPERFAERHEIGLRTYKAHVTELLAKSGASTQRSLLAMLLAARCGGEGSR